MEDNKNRRSNYYIKAEFQRSFIMKFCLLVLLGSAISGAIIYMMSRSTVTTSFEGLRLVIKSTADYILPAVVLSSAVVIIVIGLATIFITLFTSHKIAGPLYRIEKDVSEVTSGNLRKEFNLRAGDEVQAIADGLTAMTHTLRDEVGGLKQDVSELEASLGGNIPPQASEKIKSIKARLDKFRT
ncbi:MAG: hypothetical protein WCY36_04945 [Candidatus Omnitrophota bacterium]